LSFHPIRGRYAQASNTFDDNFGQASDHDCMDSGTNRCKTPRMSFIDSEYTDDTVNPKVSCLETLHLLVSMLTYNQIRNGVKMGEGDGTVSLLSLGAMCVEGWKRPRWNPAGINITTVEVSTGICIARLRVI
jgi:phospholipid:diacylglycerol acyltransferase